MSIGKCSYWWEYSSKFSASFLQNFIVEMIEHFMMNNIVISMSEVMNINNSKKLMKQFSSMDKKTMIFNGIDISNNDVASGTIFFVNLWFGINHIKPHNGIIVTLENQKVNRTIVSMALLNVVGFLKFVWNCDKNSAKNNY